MLLEIVRGLDMFQDDAIQVPDFLTKTFCRLFNVRALGIPFFLQASVEAFKIVNPIKKQMTLKKAELDPNIATF